ncbi:ricin-type beta-trefoil lectin protein [Krasilnikovia cinnamomea]|uniref:Ricin-type beta-trefoil lectin protein n=1 Tax=Krasilnikovia cinnamomea TaxID=349313 RepID=A0A4Q7ZQS9_9ACTN|nr:RICIN domain-containing protein [Krasilnikovia cinnamomea]RZU53488.1 ricin-type beta-trefoil lectin protein [Krasilnikovia cinnamomea]
MRSATTAPGKGRVPPASPAPSDTPRLGATEASYSFDTVFVVKNQVTGKALQASGARVSQEQITATSSQQWMLTANEDSSRLVSVATGQCLRVSDTGSGLEQHPCDGDDEERWDIYAAPSGGIALRSVENERCMGVRRATADGAPVVHTTCTWDPTDDQVWWMVRLA